MADGGWERSGSGGNGGGQGVPGRVIEREEVRRGVARVSLDDLAGSARDMIA